MFRSIGILLATLLLASAGNAQNTLDSVLESIRQNNKSIAAARQKAEAHKLLHRTGNAPEDPFVSADFLVGRPRSGGNQVDFIATQAFDFPTVYAKRSQLADQKDLLADLELERVVKEELWKAQQKGLSIVHLNKKRALLQERLEDAREVLADYAEKFEAGDAGALPVNKARIRVLGLEHELRMIETEIEAETGHLSILNGGIPIVLSDTSYPGPAVLPGLDSVQGMRTRFDSELRMLEQSTRVGESIVEVNKALTLPKLEAGYHYQSVLGQTFNGVHLGASIPLWEHRNTVKARHSLVEFQHKESANRRTEIEHETEHRYLHCESLLESMLAYQSALSGLSTREVLKVSLDLDEIDFITYAMELDFYYQAVEQLLEIEFSYQLTRAELYKSTL